MEHTPSRCQVAVHAQLKQRWETPELSTATIARGTLIDAGPGTDGLSGDTLTT